MILKSWNSCNVCLACILRPITDTFGKVFRFSGNCKHIIAEPFAESFEKSLSLSKYGFIYKIAFITILLIGFFYNIYLSQDICRENETDCLYLISNSALMLSGILLLMESLSKFDMWLTEMNKWAHLLDELQHEGLVSEQLQEFSVRYYRMSIITVTLELILSIWLIAVFYRDVSRKGLVFIAPEVTLLCASFIQFHIFSVTTICGFFLRKIEKLSGLTFCKKVKGGENIIKCIITYRKYQLAMTSTLKVFTNAMKYSLAICLICFVFVIIVNLYYLIIEANLKNLEMYISVIRVSSGTFMLVVSIAATDSERMVSNTYSFSKNNFGF